MQNQADWSAIRARMKDIAQDLSTIALRRGCLGNRQHESSVGLRSDSQAGRPDINRTQFVSRHSLGARSGIALMSQTMARRWLAILQSDAEAELHGHGWEVRCLHCRSRHLIAPNGTPLSAATIEHIVPQAWFGKRAAAALTQSLNGPNDLRNLAVACAGCNHGKGRGLDARGPNDPRAREVIAQLRERRMARFNRRWVDASG